MLSSIAATGFMWLCECPLATRWHLTVDSLMGGPSEDTRLQETASKF